MAGNHVAVNPPRLLREPFDQARAVEDLASRLGQRLAHLGGEDAREIVGAVEHQAVPFDEDRRALARGLGRPGGKRRRGGVDRAAVTGRSASATRRFSSGALCGLAVRRSPAFPGAPRQAAGGRFAAQPSGRAWPLGRSGCQSLPAKRLGARCKCCRFGAAAIGPTPAPALFVRLLPGRSRFSTADSLRLERRNACGQGWMVSRLRSPDAIRGPSAPRTPSRRQIGPSDPFQRATRQMQRARHLL